MNTKGITMLSLIITIIILIIISSITLGTGSNIIKKSELENLETNMLLIKVKAKEYIENANFKLGTNIENAIDKESRITNAKNELKGEEIKESNIFYEIIKRTTEEISQDNQNYIYYYKLSTTDLTEMGVSKEKSDEQNGWYIIKYDTKNVETEVYNTKGFENENKKYYTLTEIQELNI